ncbi:DUF72 domain-containing protein [Lentisalinibacter salinarum]|uniref:DUF72 domain-containing protein n=1 Tax=Lentisalinibacter salinarum TaxID=2992239 RepID=UPI003868CA7C
MSARGRIRIGTSGWSYDHWDQTFYPEGLDAEARLAFYARRFDTVEINNSFYRLPSAAQVADWRAATGRDFVFAAKASRYITHMKKLREPRESMARFFDRMDALGRNLGPLLFQLPPGWSYDGERLAAFLDALPSDARCAMEFRDHSWLNEDARQRLREHGVAWCIYDLAGFTAPKEITADFVYIRLHGPEDAYRGNYSASALSGWAGAISSWARRGLDVFCYFDNDEKACAPGDAARLRDMLGAADGARSAEPGGE